jgi:hypothetical protein
VGDACTAGCGRKPRSYEVIAADVAKAPHEELREASRAPNREAVERIARRLLSRRLTRFQFELSGLCSTCAFIALMRSDAGESEVARA